MKKIFYFHANIKASWNSIHLKIWRIVCEANCRSTTDLPRRAVASETSKEQSERKNWSFLPGMASAT